MHITKKIVLIIFILSFSPISYSADELCYSAEFDTDGDFENWQVVDGATGVSVTGGALKATTTAIDPKLRISDLNLPWQYVNRVEYRLRQKSNPYSSQWNSPLSNTGTGFGMAGHPDEGAHGWLGQGYNTITADDDGWYKIVVDMTAAMVAKGWTSPPADTDNDGLWDSIRIDPIGNDSSAYFEVDYIRVYDEQEFEEQDLYSDTWVATDALGRNLPGYDEVGPPRDNRTVAMFYFAWLGQHSTTGPWDITKILAENPTDPAWGPQHHFHHWGESEMGYYVSDDPYVIRRHASMMADAGVDVLFFDVTNAQTYENVYLTLCSVFTQIRAEGGQTPQIAFLTHSNSVSTTLNLYNNCNRSQK